MKSITSRQNPLVQRCRDLARSRPADSGLVLLDGPHLLADALQAGVPIETALVTADAAAGAEGAALVARLGRAGVELYEVPDAVLDAASPVRTPSGILAIASWGLADAVALWASPHALVVLVDSIQDPGNLGAIVRAADAAGATGVVVTGASADPLGWKALRGSMGSAFRVPLAVLPALEEALRDARTHAVRIAATTPGDGADLYACDLTDSVCVVMGAEGAGLPEVVLDAADIRLRIPMRAGVESLNVAVATGIILFEAVRQRRAGTPA